MGRVDDVTAVVKALAEHRVVSIIGVGGVGKTSLALRVGSKLVSAYRGRRVVVRAGRRA